MRPNETDRYLVQFRSLGKTYFVTDCAFRDGQGDVAELYVRRVMECGAAGVAAGRVFDCDTDVVVFTAGGAA